ncbi:MAG TPA: L,D-transpeptidase family protein, partial [Anaerolineales bacterium]|nr:L,D-transpeptidase family protein [Anaerolineales bacterium]
MLSIKRLATVIALTTGLLLSTSLESSAKAKTKKREGSPPTRVELRDAERRLSEMGFWTSRVDGVIDNVTRTGLIAFQKWEGRKVTGQLTRSELNAIRDASAPEPRESGYKHIEVDLDRQVLLLTNDEGTITRILPVSTGSGKHYREKRMSGLAYTPRGRFRIYGKMYGWRRSPLGLLYYPNYFSDGLAIHGNPEVPHVPRSHGCVRIPMFSAKEISKELPV